MNANRGQIGWELFGHLGQRLEAGEDISLLGPRNGGKALVLEGIRAFARSRAAMHRPRIVTLLWAEFQRRPQDEFIEGLADRLEVRDALPLPSLTQAGRFELLLQRAADKAPTALWVFVQDILGFPDRIARDLLLAFQSLHEHETYGPRIAVVVTGSEDFLPLTLGANSPYRYSEKYVVGGMTESFARAFFGANRRRLRGERVDMASLCAAPFETADREITAEAFAYLYAETRGDPHLLQEVILHVGRSGAERESLAADVPWDLRYARWALGAYEEVQMEQDYTCRIRSQELERREEHFEALCEVLDAAEGECRLPPRVTVQLEVSGLVSVGADGVARIASPLWRRFLERSLTDRHRADVYAALRQWHRAWPLYERVRRDLDRPVSGLSTFRLRHVLARWEQSFSEFAVRGTQALCHHLLMGAKQLLRYDHGGFFRREGAGVVEMPVEGSPLPEPPPARRLPGAVFTRLELPGVKGVWLSNQRLDLASDSGLKLTWPANVRPWVQLGRDEGGKEIDAAEQEYLPEVLSAFWRAYEHARQLEYRQLIGEIREKHLLVIQRLNEKLVQGTTDMGAVVQATAKELVESAGYLRVQICLVDGRRETIQAVAAHSLEHTDGMGIPTNYRLTATPGPAACAQSGPCPHPLPPKECDWDVQQWVVLKNCCCAIRDAASPEQRSPRTQWEIAQDHGIQAITVVPIRCEGEVIGTVHFERRDKAMPSGEEQSLFEVFASQLGLVLMGAQRLTMLEQALHQLDSAVSIVSPLQRLLFLNKSAARQGYPDHQPGWQHGAAAYAGFPSPPHAGTEGPGALFEEVERTGSSLRRYFFPKTAGRTEGAYDWLLAPIDDFRQTLPAPFTGACARIGYVEKATDLSELFQLLEALRTWYSDPNLHTTAQRILQYFRDQGFRWCRLYLEEQDVNGRRALRSLAEFGLQQPDNQDRFRGGQVVFPEGDEADPQAWHVFKVGREAVYRYVVEPGAPPEHAHRKVEPAASRHGVPLFVCNYLGVHDQDWLEKEPERDTEWLEAPLVLGAQTVGKLTASMPRSGMLRPERWELFGYACLGAACALGAARLAGSQLEAEVRRSWTEAAQMAKHQLGNKLAMAAGFLMTARSALAPGPGTDASLAKDVGHASELVETARRIVADFGRYADERPIRGLAAVKADQLCHRVFDGLRAEHPSLRLIPTVDPALGTVETVDCGSLLAEVLGNLITNSRMHSQRSTAELEIRLSASLLPGGPRVGDSGAPSPIRIRYHDNGAGVPATMRERLFQPFQSSHAQGTGLGLPIARRLLQRIGATIEFDDKETSGAAFRIHLPRYLDTP